MLGILVTILGCFVFQSDPTGRSSALEKPLVKIGHCNRRKRVWKTEYG